MPPFTSANLLRAMSVRTPSSSQQKLNQEDLGDEEVGLSMMVRSFLTRVLNERKEFVMMWEDHDIRVMYEYFLDTALPNQPLADILKSKADNAPGDGDGIVLKARGVSSVLKMLRIGLEDANKQGLIQRHLQSLQLEHSKGLPRKDRSKQEDEFTIDFRGFLALVYSIMHDDEPEEVNLQADAWFPFDPDHRNKNIWDLFMVILLLYTTFAVPYMIAFVESGDPRHLEPFDIWDIFLDCTFMTDIVINFCTAYYHQGEYVTDLNRIAVNYITSWFFLDFAGSFPFDKVVGAIVLAQGSDGADLSFMKAFRIVRMLKLIRAVRLMDKLNQLEQKDGFGVFKKTLRIFKSIFLMVFVSHLLGCFFTMLIDPNSEDNWLYAYDPKLMDAPVWERYTVSLYWAIITISTMGYGDVLPVTSMERIFSIAVALIGAVVFSYSMGNITSLISQTAGADVKFDEKLRFVEEWLEFRKVSQQAKRQIKSFLHKGWKSTGALFDEKENLKELPRGARIEIMKNIYKTRVSELQLENPHAVDQSFTSVFSSKFSEELMGSLLSRMTSMTVEDGTILYEFGSFGAEAFLVDSGEIELVPFKREEAHKEQSMHTCPNPPQPELIKTMSLSSFKREEEKASLREPARSMSLDSRGNSRKIIKKGQSFGVMALFPDICQYRAETARVRTKNGSPAEVLVLSKDDFEEIAQEHPELKDVLREYAELSAVEMRQKKLHLEIKRMNSKSRELGMGEFDLQVTKFRHELRLNAIKRMNFSGADTFQVYMSSDGQEQEKIKVNSLIPSASTTGLGLTMGSDKTPLTSRLGRIVTLESDANGSPFEVATGWQLSTCWITDEGELQYFHDSEEGLVTETCSSHGFMIPGRSTVQVDSSPDLTGYYTARINIFKSKTSKVSKLISIKAPDANDFRPLEDHLSKSVGDTNNPAASAKFKSAFGKLKLKSVMAIANAGKLGSSSKLSNHGSFSGHAPDNDVDTAAASAGANAGEAQSNRKPWFEIGSGEDGAASELRIELSNSVLQLASPIRTTNSGNFDSVSQRRQEAGATAEALEKHRVDIKADMDRLSDRVYGVERKMLMIMDKLDTIISRQDSEASSSTYPGGVSAA